MYNLRDALQVVFSLGDMMNKYIDTKKPWELKEETQKSELVEILLQI